MFNVANFCYTLLDNKWQQRPNQLLYKAANNKYIAYMRPVPVLDSGQKPSPIDLQSIRSTAYGTPIGIQRENLDGVQMENLQ